MTQQTDTKNRLKDVVDNLEQIGRGWAVYGRGMGRTALKQGAASLRTTASFLDQLSTRIPDGEDNKT